MANRDIWDEIELVGKGEHLDEEMFEFLSAYADGECSAKERRLVEAYLAESVEARAQLADLRMQAAIASEGFVDPPEWLRGAILSKTVDRPRLKWPFAAAVTAATAGAAALAVYWVLPAQTLEPKTDLLANVVIDQPAVEEPFSIVPDESISPNSTSEAVTSGTTQLQQNDRLSRRENSGGMSLASREIVPTKGEDQSPSNLVVRSEPKAEEEPDPAITYAVVEYGGGRFESKQPDVFDSEPQGAEPSSAQTSTSPTVLPDAREKLRDKVRKMNEEKLEIEGKDEN